MVGTYHIIFSVFICLVVLPGVLLFSFKGPSLSADQEIKVIALPVSFDPNAADRIKFGKLLWRGGLVLTSDDKRFGGISGIIVDQQGKNMVGITDNGSWIKAELIYKNGKLSGIEHVFMGALKGKDRTPFLLPWDRDAEAIAAMQDRFLISFERRHRIGEFASVDGRPGYQVGQIDLPEESLAMADNGGIEGFDVLRGGELKGSIVAFSESFLDADQFIKGWIINGKMVDKIYLKAMGGFSITEVVSLDDGSLLFLERRYTRKDGVSMRVRFVKSEYVKPDARLTGVVLFEGNSDFEIDNMEGLAVHKNSQGRIILTLISDDNFSAKQKTLLLQFELAQKLP